MPLAPGGDKTLLTEEEMEKLPIDLQYLPPGKRREPRAEIRCLLLESLFQLCNSLRGRTLIRESHIYYILRELHHWERDPEVLVILENLIDVIIKREEEMGIEKLDKLKDLIITDDLIETFNRINSGIN